MDDRMERRPPWVPWAITSLVLVIVAMVAFGLGAQQEAATTTGPHWHWGFPGIWGLFFLFWMFGGFRWVWGGGCYRPWRYRRYDRRYDDDYDEWREWHRREHERTDGSRSESRPIT